MSSASAGAACRGACLHEIEFIPSADGADEHADAAEDEVGFCDFVCQFISLDCPRTDKCVEQPCTN